MQFPDGWMLLHIQRNLLCHLVIALGLIAAIAGCRQAPPEYVSHYTPSPATTQAPPGPAAVAIIGGSYTAGTVFGGMGRNGWPALTATRLGQQGIDIIPSVGAEDGSGYVTPGDDHRTVLADQIPMVVRPDDKLVVIFGSRSESDVPTEVLEPSVRHSLDAVQAAAPDAKIIVIGPVSTEPDPPENVLKSRDVARTEADSTGATFVDPIAEGWFLNLPDLIGPDGMHPTDAGHTYLADKIAPLISQQLQ
jgi:lysophospholipase L1-like esterase